MTQSDKLRGEAQDQKTSHRYSVVPRLERAQGIGREGECAEAGQWPESPAWRVLVASRRASLMQWLRGAACSAALGVCFV